MIAAGIVVHWESHWETADEYIEIDLIGTDKQSGVTSTLEWWKSKNKFVRYNVRSEIECLGAGSTILTLHYDRQENGHLHPEDSLWGTSTIHLTAAAASGDVTWRDNDDSSNDGATRWELINCGLFKEKKKEVLSRLQRDQVRFRGALLAYECCCALSGESTPEVLEAAHIIGSREGGAEVVQNGILLRADIHRLYDAGKFAIAPSGEVVDIAEDIAPAYFAILRNARIPGKTIERTKSALLHLWNVRTEQPKL
jgi:putative restriction endonuclease